MTQKRLISGYVSGIVKDCDTVYVSANFDALRIKPVSIDARTVLDAGYSVDHGSAIIAIANVGAGQEHDINLRLVPQIRGNTAVTNVGVE